MRPYILAETNWEALQDADFELAVLPWGATEAHNYHLPYSTDIIEAELIAARSAEQAWDKGAKVIVLPTIPFGVNTGQMDINLTVNINPSTQFSILQDIVEGLNNQGIYKLVIFNSHGGNEFRPMVRELGAEYPEMFICIVNFYQALELEEYFENPGNHADEMETSLMLYLKPELVLPREKWGSGEERKNRIKAFSEDWVWAERRWSEVSEDTGIGDPSLASHAKGEKFFNALTKKIAELFIQLENADIDDLYE